MVAGRLQEIFRQASSGTVPAGVVSRALAVEDDLSHKFQRLSCGLSSDVERL